MAGASRSPGELSVFAEKDPRPLAGATRGHRRGRAGGLRGVRAPRSPAWWSGAAWSRAGPSPNSALRSALSRSMMREGVTSTGAAW